MAESVVESFHSRVRDEMLKPRTALLLRRSPVVIEDWREDYNTQRPHSALGSKAPAVFRVLLDATRTRDLTRRARRARTESPPLGSPSDSQRCWQTGRWSWRLTERRASGAAATLVTA